MMRPKILHLLFTAIVLTVAVTIYLLKDGSDRSPLTQSVQPIGTSDRSEHQTPRQKAAVVAYDHTRNPRDSAAAAQIYFKERDRMLRAHRGNDFVDSILKGMRSGKNLGVWLGQAMTYEVAEALPFIVSLLQSPDPADQRMAADVLCSFGDKRGFDFLIEKLKQDEFKQWISLFSDHFRRETPPGFEATLQDIESSDSGDAREQKYRSYMLNKMLVEIGDAEAARTMLSLMRSDPPLSADDVLMFQEVDTIEVTTALQSWTESGANEPVKQAATLLLARRGDKGAERWILSSAAKVISLPLPDENRKTGGIPSASWDAGAVMALKEGVAWLPEEQAVPLLQDIALKSTNVKFSVIAVEQLAWIGSTKARAAIWEVTAAVNQDRRVKKEILFVPLQKALSLFGDESSKRLMESNFPDVDRQEIDFYRWVGQTRGWDGLFRYPIAR